MLFDITTIEKSIESIVNYLNIEKKDLLEYLQQHSFDFDVHQFLKDFYIQQEELSTDDLSVVAFHLTSSNNECEDFKQNGIMGAGDVMKKENALTNYLKEQDIHFSDDFKHFEYKGKEYNIERFDLYNRLVDENHVHCFLTVDDSGYFSEQLQIRPDIITLLSDIVSDPSLKDFWDLNHETYMIKYIDALESFDYTSICQYDSKIEAILELIIYAVDMILFNGHVEISAWMKKDHIVSKEDIVYTRKYYNN